MRSLTRLRLLADAIEMQPGFWREVAAAFSSPDYLCLEGADAKVRWLTEWMAERLGETEPIKALRAIFGPAA